MTQEKGLFCYHCGEDIVSFMVLQGGNVLVNFMLRGLGVGGSVVNVVRI